MVMTGLYNRDTTMSSHSPKSSAMNGTGGAATARVARVAIVTCAVLEREIEHFAAGQDHIVHIELMEQGLHNEPLRLRKQLQAAIDRIEAATPAEVIVLGYGLCSRGTEGVVARRCRLVIARAHDCITLLLGDRRRYAAYVAEHPGTYWYSPGWNKHHLPPGRERYEKYYAEYVERYGEDNAQYLMETEQNWFSTYQRATYVDLTIGATDEDIAYTQDCARWLGWEFDHQQGNADLLRSLLEGRWDDDRFLVVPPGQTLRGVVDDRIVEVVPGPVSEDG